MTPVEICDLLDRLAGWPWPLTPAATQARLALELGYDLVPTSRGMMTVKNRAVGDGDAEALLGEGHMRNPGADQQAHEQKGSGDGPAGLGRSGGFHRVRSSYVALHP